jgi:hypothetical protein
LYASPLRTFKLLSLPLKNIFFFCKEEEFGWLNQLNAKHISYSHKVITYVMITKRGSSSMLFQLKSLSAMPTIFLKISKILKTKLKNGNFFFGANTPLFCSITHTS